jgi:predicted protein tyrosine phosphatase
VEFFVYSRRAVELIAPFTVPHIFVSITTPGDSEGPAKLPENEHTRGVLRLAFSDIDVIREGSAFGEDPDDTRVLFAPEHGEQVVSFVSEHLDHIEAIIVHCDAGMSRSPGVAAALARLCNVDDSPFFKRYHPNMRVYRGILTAYYQKHQP